MQTCRGAEQRYDQPKDRCTMRGRGAGKRLKSGRVVILVCDQQVERRQSKTVCKQREVKRGPGITDMTVAVVCFEFGENVIKNDLIGSLCCSQG